VKKARDKRRLVLPIVLSVLLMLPTPLISFHSEYAFAGDSPLAAAPPAREALAVADDGSQIKLLLRGEDAGLEYSLDKGLTWEFVPPDRVIVTQDGIRISVNGQGEADYYLMGDAIVNPGTPGTDGNNGDTGANQGTGGEQTGGGAGTDNASDGQDPASDPGTPSSGDVAISEPQTGEEIAFAQEREQTEGLAALTADGVDSLTAEQALDGGWLYRVNADNESVTILSYGGDPNRIHIPSQIDGKLVTVIGDAAFSSPQDWGGSEVWEGTNGNHFGLEGIVIPSGVTTIGRNAFRGIWSGDQGALVLPAGLVSIGDYAFACDRDSYGTIANGGYLAGLNLPAGLSRIGSSAFANNYIEGSINFNGSSTAIGDHAFAGAEVTGSINLDGSAVYIGDYAFANSYSGNSSITLPVSVRIGKYAFAGSSLTTAYLEGGRQQIEAYAFADASKLATADIPSTVQTIGDYAFAGTALPGELSLPSSCRTIGIYAFANTKSLTGLTLPGTLFDVSIGAFAGSGISSLTMGEGIGTIDSEAFADCVNLKEVTVPSSVTELGYRRTIEEGNGPTFRGAFAGCTALEKITIPASVTSMGASTLENVPPGMLGYVESNTLAAKVLTEQGYSCHITAYTLNRSVRISFWFYPYDKPLPADTVLSLTNLPESVLPASFVEEMSKKMSTQVDLAFHITLTSGGKDIEPKGVLSVTFYPSSNTSYMRTSSLYVVSSQGTAKNPALYQIWMQDTDGGKGLEFAWPYLQSQIPTLGKDAQWEGNFLYAHYGLPPLAPEDKRPSMDEREDDKNTIIRVIDTGSGSADEFVRADGSDPKYSSRDGDETKTAVSSSANTKKSTTTGIGDTKTPQGDGLDGEDSVDAAGVNDTNGLAAGVFTVRLAGFVIDINWIALAILAAVIIGVVLFYFAQAKRMRFEEELL
jgi:hypothetical protein